MRCLCEEEKTETTTFLFNLYVFFTTNYTQYTLVFLLHLNDAYCNHYWYLLPDIDQYLTAHRLLRNARFSSLKELLVYYQKKHSKIFAYTFQIFR